MVVAIVLATLPAVLLGMSIRVWVVFNDAPTCGSQAASVAPMCLGPYSDTAVMGALSAGVLRGQGFADPLQPYVPTPRATAAPVLPMMLAVGDLLGFSDLQAKRAFAGLLGALGAVVVGGVAMMLDRARVGAAERTRPAVAGAAAGVVALSPFWVIDAVTLRPDLVFVPLLAVLLLRLVAAGDGTSVKDAAIDGLLIGAVVLTRADGVVIALASLIGIGIHLYGRSGAQATARSVGMTVVSVIGVTLPWLVFNLAVGNGFMVAERGIFDSVASNIDEYGDWGSLTTLGWIARVGLFLLGAFGAVRRSQRGEVVWPFGLFAAVSVGLVALVGVASGPLVPLEVAAVLLAAPVVVDGLTWVWHEGMQRASTMSPRLPRMAVGARNTLLVGLFLVFLASAGVRLWIVNVQRPICVERFDPTRADQCWELAGDARVFVKTARAVSKGDGFVFEGRPSATHPPMFTLFLAAVDLTGNDDIGLRRNLAALVGSAGVVTITIASYRLARRAQLPAVTAAAWTGGIAAVYPAFWLNDAMLYSESLLLVTGGVLVLVACELCERPSLRWGVAFGGALGIAALTRAEVVVIAVPVAIAYLVAGVRAKRWTAYLVHMLAAAFTLAVVLAPWAAYNQGRFSKPVVMTTTPGGTLAEVTCDSVFYGELLGYYNLGCLPVLIMLHPDESVSDARAMNVATRYLRQNAGRYPVQVAAAVGRSSELYRPAHNANLSALFEVRGFAGSFSAVFAHLLLMPLAVTGLVALRRRKVALAPFAGTVLSVVVAVAFIGAIARMRLMVDISIVMLAGMGLAWLHQFLDAPTEAIECPT